MTPNHRAIWCAYGAPISAATARSRHTTRSGRWRSANSSCRPAVLSIDGGFLAWVGIKHVEHEQPAHVLHGPQFALGAAVGVLVFLHQPFGVVHAFPQLKITIGTAGFIISAARLVEIAPCLL